VNLKRSFNAGVQYRPPSTITQADCATSFCGILARQSAAVMVKRSKFSLGRRVGSFWPPSLNHQRYSMTPNSFDVSTSKEITGDARCRSIESKARLDADAGNYDPPKISNSSSYWAKAQEDFEVIVYFSQYQKRLDRNLRKAERDSLSAQCTAPQHALQSIGQL
jgi:hypothetical protein